MPSLAAPALALAASLAGPYQDTPPEALNAVALPSSEELELAPWRAHLLPAAGELERIPWVPSFAEGVLRSAREQRPLLFWAMNGHPLACT